MKSGTMKRILNNGDADANGTFRVVDDDGDNGDHDDDDDDDHDFNNVFRRSILHKTSWSKHVRIVCYKRRFIVNKLVG